MKSKYLSRKFLLALAWTVFAIVAILLSKDKLVYLSALPSLAFILGESFVDAKSSVKQSMDVTKYVQHNIKEDKTNASAEETVKRD